MSQASLLALLLLALALAVQPWSVLASIALVTSEHGVRKTAAFVIGWALALAAVALIAVAVAPATRTSSTNRFQSEVEVALGTVLGVWLLIRWRQHRGVPAKQPSWMAKLDAMGVWLALALGAFLPNYVVVVAAVNELVLAGVHGWELAAAVMCFVVVASLGVAAPLVVIAIDRHHADERLARWRAWLGEHNREVLYSVGLVVAVALIVKGVIGLAG